LNHPLNEDVDWKIYLSSILFRGGLGKGDKRMEVGGSSEYPPVKKGMEKNFSIFMLR